jgi:hypothetical protein
MAGSMWQRDDDSWQPRVNAGRDAVTGRKRYVERTVRGNKREASKALAALVTETEKAPLWRSDDHRWAESVHLRHLLSSESG